MNKRKTLNHMIKEFDIIYEDNDIILCHKPVGTATQTKRLGQQDMESLLKNYRVKKGEPPYIGIIHRLDQPVEGIMVFAKNQKAAASLSKQVQKRMIGKYYYAVSNYAPIEPQGILEDYLLTDKRTNFTKVMDGINLYQVGKDAKHAKLEYKVLDKKEDKTLFDIKLHTGRQHQIRVQMAHMGCPLVGDNKYGIGQCSSISQDLEEKDSMFARKDAVVSNKKEGLGLCSYKLEFEHPDTGKEMQFSIVPKGALFKEFM